MSLLLNMLSRLVITLLPRSKCLLISWLQSPSAVIFEPNLRREETKRKKEFNLEAWAKETKHNKLKKIMRAEKYYTIGGTN